MAAAPTVTNRYLYSRPLLHAVLASVPVQPRRALASAVALLRGDARRRRCLLPVGGARASAVVGAVGGRSVFACASRQRKRARSVRFNAVDMHWERETAAGRRFWPRSRWRGRAAAAAERWSDSRTERALLRNLLHRPRRADVAAVDSVGGGGAARSGVRCGIRRRVRVRWVRVVKDDMGSSGRGACSLLGAMGGGLHWGGKGGARWRSGTRVGRVILPPPTTSPSLASPCV